MSQHTRRFSALRWEVSELRRHASAVEHAGCLAGTASVDKLEALLRALCIFGSNMVNSFCRLTLAATSTFTAVSRLFGREPSKLGRLRRRLSRNGFSNSNVAQPCTLQRLFKDEFHYHLPISLDKTFDNRGLTG